MSDVQMKSKENEAEEYKAARTALNEACHVFDKSFVQHVDQFMTGMRDRKQKLIPLVRRCIELDPDERVRANNTSDDECLYGIMLSHIKECMNKYQDLGVLISISAQTKRPFDDLMQHYIKAKQEAEAIENGG